MTLDEEIKILTKKNDQLNILKLFIKDLGGEYGWKDSDPFVDNARKLIEKGFTVEEIKDLLGELHTCMMNEYGA